MNILITVYRLTCEKLGSCHFILRQTTVLPASNQWKIRGEHHTIKRVRRGEWKFKQISTDRQEKKCMPLKLTASTQHYTSTQWGNIHCLTMCWVLRT